MTAAELFIRVIFAQLVLVVGVLGATALAYIMQDAGIGSWAIVLAVSALIGFSGAAAQLIIAHAIKAVNDDKVR